ERREDIMPLTRLFLERFSRQFKKEFREISPAAERTLVEYPWPGNIRELKNLMERTVLLETGPLLDTPQLKLAARARPADEVTLGQRIDECLSAPLPTEGIPFETLIEGVERALIMRASYATKWNQSR